MVTLHWALLLSGGDDADGGGCQSFPVPGCKNCAYELFVHTVGKINAKLSNNAINLNSISVPGNGHLIPSHEDYSRRRED